MKRKLLTGIELNNMCAIVQTILSHQLCDRLERALVFIKNSDGNSLLSSCVVSGGVASNLFIRNELKKVCDKYEVEMKVPPIEYCSDNGVMIAWNGNTFKQTNKKEIKIINSIHSTTIEI
jgi:N6-L-threonylcarbamoyladenine synthase